MRDWTTLREAAKELGVSYVRACQLKGEGRLITTTDGEGRIKVSRSSLDELIREREMLRSLRTQRAAEREPRAAAERDRIAREKRRAIAERERERLEAREARKQMLEYAERIATALERIARKGL